MGNLVRACIAALMLLPGASWSSACTRDGQPIDEERFVAVGGIEQWITIRGADCRNPVVLFVHGGPGNPMSPFARNIYGEWEREFTLVQWDKRGAGQTFARNPSTEGTTLTIERMAQDGVELAEHLAQYLGQPKLVVMGGSWGSALAVHMVRSRPDLFRAYVGTGQLVGRENPLASYRKTLQLAHEAGDAKTVAALEALGAPPWTDPRSMGALRRATRIYEGKASDPAPRTWWRPTGVHATPAAQAAAEAGEDYSYLQFVGRRGDGMLWKFDLAELGTAFAVPVFLVQGEHDLVTTPEVARRYFDGISAPEKEFVLLPRTGHDPNPAMVEAQYRLLKERVLRRR